MKLIEINAIGPHHHQHACMVTMAIDLAAPVGVVLALRGPRRIRAFCTVVHDTRYSR
jgi:hypothetical protein